MKALSKLSDKNIKILLYVVFAIGSVLCAINLCVPGVLDEVGTLANTAFMAGDDWSKCVQSMGGFYYKYGQSVLYYPFYLLLRRQPYVMYPVLVSFQMLILSLTPVIAYHISRKYLKVESKLTALLISVAGTGISSIWLYAEYTRGDLMLIFLPWPLALILLKLSTLNKEDNKTQRNLLSILLAFVAVYAYSAHSRGIVLVIATALTVIFASLFLKKHLVNYLYYIPASAVFLAIDKVLSGIFKKGVFGQYQPKHANADSFDYETFMKIFTKG